MKYVAYYRVSTKKQGDSGLGLEAQDQAVRVYLKQCAGVLIDSYTEVESGTHNKRPQLQAALQRCKLTNAVLVVAKLDRLSRNAAFVMTLQDAGIRFVACDNPNANELTVGILAVIAQHEAKMISERTKAALQAAKARGIKLGTNNLPADSNVKAAQALSQAADARAAALVEVLANARDAGCNTLQSIADHFNNQHIQTPRGKCVWYPTTVANLVKRLEG